MPAMRDYKRLQQGVYITLWMVLLALIVWGFTIITSPDHFPVEKIHIHADYRYVTQLSLENAILPYMDKSFFTLNAEKLRQNLLQLPWVDEVAIRKVWPDQLVIDILPKQAIARIGQDKLLSNHGQVFQPPLTTFPTHLIQFNGPDPEIPLLWQQYQAMALLLKPLGLSINELDLNARQAWQLRLNNGITVLLGRGDVMGRLARLVAVYPKIIKGHEQGITAIDLRYSSGLAVKYKKLANHP